MEICYRREMRHNYLVIVPETGSGSDYEVRMMEHNEMRYLLKFRVNRTDDICSFCYEITSLQPLSRILDSQMVSGAELRSIILAVAGCLETLEDYLLPEHSLMLDPDYIYIEPETFRLSFCLVPGFRQDFPEAVRELLRYLLSLVDHQDKESVVLAYGLYQESQKENFGINDLLRFLEQPNAQGQYKGGEARQIREDVEEYGNNGVKRYGDKDTKRYGDKVSQKYEDGPFKMYDSKSTERSSDPEPWWAQLTKKFGWKSPDVNKTTANKTAANKTAANKTTVNKAAREGGESHGEYMRWEDLLTETDQHTSLPVVQRDVNQEPTTVLLTDLGSGTGDFRLKALHAELSDIILSSFPFIIGKQSSLADYQLDKETVSRLHVKIEKVGDDFYITDLNSTNGTRVRGILLANNDKKKLYIDDEIQIAEWKYRFVRF